jgi:hypothetical protein
VEPITAIVISLALGASAVAGTSAVDAVVKDAYGKLKQLIRGRYPDVPVDLLEKSPQSKSRRGVVEEELAKLGAVDDLDLVAAAQDLTRLIQQRVPAVATAIGVDIKDVEAANIRLAGIKAADTGVRIERAKLSGDIDIRDVHSGLQRNGLPREETTKKGA